VAYTAAVPQWTLNMAAGSLQEWTFTLTQSLPASAPPYPITGATWEYVARQSAAPGSSLVFEVTTTVSASGLITVTDTSSVSSVLLAIYPAATSALAAGTYSHSLWMNPGTASASCVVTGSLIVTAAAQP
jgi:hypothetical protein